MIADCSAMFQPVRDVSRSTLIINAGQAPPTRRFEYERINHNLSRFIADYPNRDINDYLRGF